MPPRHRPTNLSVLLIDGRVPASSDPGHPLSHFSNALSRPNRGGVSGTLPQGRPSERSNCERDSPPSTHADLIAAWDATPAWDTTSSWDITPDTTWGDGNGAWGGSWGDVTPGDDGRDLSSVANKSGMANVHLTNSSPYFHFFP